MKGDRDVLLDVRDLKKSFGSRIAVQGLSFTLSRGEFVGLLGPNGAGKTTTIKMLTGLVRPSGGSAAYDGIDFMKAPEVGKRIIGVVPQQSNVDRDLTAYENLYLHCLLHAIPASQRRARIDEALSFAGLSGMRDAQVKTFSGGMKRRLVIVRSLLHDPRILFLDEPTTGLDPSIRRNIWDLVIRANRVKGTAVLLTTHYIEEAEKLCERVMIIDRGSIIADGTLGELKRGLGHYALEMYREDGIEEAFFETKEEALNGVRDCDDACKVREITLEDVFLKMTGRRINV
ncbi:MAG: ABC transporter ATP-binding protein [Thermodesulfovibrionales bacterium]